MNGGRELGGSEGRAQDKCQGQHYGAGSEDLVSAWKIYLSGIGWGGVAVREFPREEFWKGKRSAVSTVKDHWRSKLGAFRPPPLYSRSEP